MTTARGFHGGDRHPPAIDYPLNTPSTEGFPEVA
jgi:hypothetical protein